MAAPETPFAAGQDNLWTKILDHNKLAARQPGTTQGFRAHVLLTGSCVQGRQASWEVHMAGAMRPTHASPALSAPEGFTRSSLILDPPSAGFPRGEAGRWGCGRGEVAELARCRTCARMCCAEARPSP